MKHKIYIVGMGPGEEAMMTMQAYDTLLACDTIIGYQVYLKLEGEGREKSFPDLQWGCGGLWNGIFDV